MSKSSPKSVALWVLMRLRGAGYDAYFAGGCVRDMLLGCRCNDYDIASSATPAQVRKLFKRVILVGAKFGVAVVLRDKKKVEVATFRSDLSYSDGRHPDGVRFTSPKEDALRRDFTINGMFYDPVEKKVTDYVNGRKDLASKVIRTIGAAQKRFGEDYLRMIRAVRFAARLDFTIDGKTLLAIKKNAPKISGISGERIFDELEKMFASPSPAEALRMLCELGLFRYILPELAGENLSRAMERMRCFVKSKARAGGGGEFASLLMDIKKSEISRIVRRWGAANAIRSRCIWIAENRDTWKIAADMPLCQFKPIVSNVDFPLIKTLWKIRERMETGKASQCLKVIKRANKISPKLLCPDALIFGDDLMRMGMKEGRQLGDILRKIRDAQLNEEIRTPSQAKKFAAELIQGALTL